MCSPRADTQVCPYKIPENFWFCTYISEFTVPNMNVYFFLAHKSRRCDLGPFVILCRSSSFETGTELLLMFIAKIPIRIDGFGRQFVENYQPI
jgi:hypothetical protein